MQFLRYVFAASAILFVAGVVFQVFLAGMFLFAGGERATHIEFGYLLELAPLIVLVFAFAARAGRRLTVLSGLLAIDVIVQGSLPYFKDSVAIVAALHPVNALLVLWLSVTVARGAYGFARAAVPARAAAREAAAIGQGG
jgi:mercuric ion transport protein